MKRTKTTKIEKKYKDKKTGEWKSLTIDYAKVIDRLQVFWEENPNGKIETEPTMNDGQVLFKATVVRDQKDPHSKTATGHTLGVHENEKDFEKLETLAVGRALALLGYAGSGEIASDEEMKEFEKFQEEQKQKILDEAQEKLMAVKGLEELKKVWSALPVEAKEHLTELKDQLKKDFVLKEKGIKDDNKKV